MWEEIQDMPGEIFDIPDDIEELQELQESEENEAAAQPVG